MTTLVIAAHPDDEVLGCGGTIAHLVTEGASVYIAILGEGITSRQLKGQKATSLAVKTLRARSHQVAEILGATEVFNYSLPDNSFDTVPMLSVVKIIEELVDRVKPDIVFTQHGGDLNIDHVVTFRATLTATRPMAGGQVRAVYAYEVASSTEWAFGQFEPHFNPNVFFDISETIETKIRAMQTYESEARPFPHPRSPEALRARAQYWGCVSGLKAAEAFTCIRMVVSGDAGGPMKGLGGSNSIPITPCLPLGGL